MTELVLLGGPTADDAHSASPAPDIVLVHGYGSDSQSWVGIAPALSALRNVWALDLPGHGKARNEKPADSIDALVDQIKDTVFNVSEQPIHLIGHSIGGTLAMLLAQHQPDRVKSLVLLAPAGLGQGVNEAFINRYPQLINEEETLSELRSLVYDDRLISDVFAQLVLAQLNRDGVRKALSDIGALVLHSKGEQTRVAKALSNSRIRRLVIWGKQDKINRFDNNDVTRFGGAWQLLENCGHLPHIEHRITVNKTIDQFLTESE